MLKKCLLLFTKYTMSNKSDYITCFKIYMIKNIAFFLIIYYLVFIDGVGS